MKSHSGSNSWLVVLTDFEQQPVCEIQKVDKKQVKMWTITTGHFELILHFAPTILTLNVKTHTAAQSGLFTNVSQIKAKSRGKTAIAE